MTTEVRTETRATDAGKTTKRRFITALLALTLGAILVLEASAAYNVYFLRQENRELRERVDVLSGIVSQQMADMDKRMEQMLKMRDPLLLDYGFELKYADYATGEVQLEFYAVPRDYAEGMTAHFSLNGQTAKAQYTDGRFVAALAADMYAEPAEQKYCVSFEHEGVSRTQQLEDINVFDVVEVPALALNTTGASYIGHYINADVSKANAWRQTYYMGSSENREHIVVGQLQADENHSSLMARCFGFGIFKNGELVYFSPRFDPDKLPEDPLGNGAFPLTLDIDMPAMAEGDRLQVVEGVLDEYGRLHTTESWEVRANEKLMLDFCDENNSELLGQLQQELAGYLRGE